jgi:hypothetical protein
VEVEAGQRLTSGCMQVPATQRLVLRIIGVAGAALFAFFFALTYHTPTWVEDFAASYIESQVAEKVDTTIDGLGPPAGDGALSRYAAELYRKNEAKISEYRQLLKGKVREQLAICIPQVRALGEEQRRKLEQWVEDGAVLSIGDLQLENSKLAALIQGGYLQVANDLKREIRLFTASNALAFLLLVLVSFRRPAAMRELFVPGVLLAISTLLCATLYVFEQDWLLTIFHGDYLGLAYAAYLAVAYGFLCDIWLNEARVTIRVIDAVWSGLGSLASS